MDTAYYIGGVIIVTTFGGWIGGFEGIVIGMFLATALMYADALRKAR